MKPVNQERILGLFAKYWVAGEVKTRLAETQGQVFAAQLYQRMLAAGLEELGTVLAKRQLLFAPADRHSEFNAIAGATWQTRPQADGGLTERLEDFFSFAMDSGCAQVIAVGSDCPELTSHHVEMAFDDLNEVDAVLGPATDGGYYLIGLTRPVPNLFRDMPWSTSIVLKETLERLRRAGCRCRLLPQLDDLDDAQSLQSIRERLSDAESFANLPGPSENFIPRWPSGLAFKRFREFLLNHRLEEKPE